MLKFNRLNTIYRTEGVLSGTSTQLTCLIAHHPVRTSILSKGKKAKGVAILDLFRRKEMATNKKPPENQRVSLFADIRFVARRGIEPLFHP